MDHHWIDYEYSNTHQCDLCGTLRQFSHMARSHMFYNLPMGIDWTLRKVECTEEMRNYYLVSQVFDD